MSVVAASEAAHLLAYDLCSFLMLLFCLMLILSKGTTAGAGSVPPGLQEGMEGMKVGSRRKVQENSLLIIIKNQLY
jgi:hypothetical protein